MAGESTGCGGERGAVPGLEELPLHPGLCATCLHLRLLRSPRSTFVRCAKADEDPRFPRYPRLPVVACAGFTPRADRAPAEGIEPGE